MDLFFSLNIGVIGGADGPTAIFVSGGPSVWFWVGVGITVVAARWFICLLVSKTQIKLGLLLQLL